MNKKLLLLLATFALVLVLAACGAKETPANTSSGTPASANTETAAGEAQEIVIKASDWDFDQPEYRVKKGDTVTFSLENTSGTHAVKINNLNLAEIREGKPQTITLDNAGEYEIKCSLPCGQGHMQMTAKLIVE